MSTKTQPRKEKKSDDLDWIIPGVDVLERLPAEVWTLVFSLCDVDVLFALAKACKFFNNCLADNAQFWLRYLKTSVAMDITWIHPLFETQLKRLVWSVLLGKCFQCGKKTTQYIEVGSLIYVHVCDDCITKPITGRKNLQNICIDEI
jgi:hypothetical protein